MTQRDPVWREAAEAAEEYQDMKRRHRADGVVCPAEDAAEVAYAELVLVPAVGNVASVLDFAVVAMRRGPESVRARELAADRRRWLARGVVAFPAGERGQGDDDGPGGGAGALKEAA